MLAIRRLRSHAHPLLFSGRKVHLLRRNQTASRHPPIRRRTYHPLLDGWDAYLARAVKFDPAGTAHAVTALSGLPGEAPGRLIDGECSRYWTNPVSPRELLDSSLVAGRRIR